MSSRNKIIAVVAGVAVFAAVSASAATLGGLETNDLGANSNTVKAQVTGGVKVAWTTAYDSTLGGYKVTALALTPVTGTISATAKVSVTLKSTTGASLGEYTSNDGGATWTAPVATISANSVYGISVVINGGSVTVAATAVQ
jgi:hypothetical protein